MTQTRKDIGKAILSLNDEQSIRNRKCLDALGLLAVNVLASPGAGKTSVITRLLQDLSKTYSVGVIEGDVASSIDTDKLRALGFAATQINTDGGCHLDANMIFRAIDSLGVKGPGYLFIENIGNLICPTNFHLGESVRLVIASVPEGDDKPAKYPGVFATADAVVLNKMDLLAHVDFRMDFFTSCIRTINPKAPILNVSCRTGEGFPELLDWLKTNAKP
jgi:hydrogenase nickel incorporation protein HypB